MSDPTRLMLRLTRTLADMPPEEALSLRLCRAFVRIVEARSGAVTLGVTTSERSVLCATSPEAARFEDAQDLVQEGPALDAFRTGELVRSLTGSESARRWPRLTELASGLRLGAVDAIPIRPDGGVFGVLTVHHDRDDAPPSTDVDLQFLTNAVGAAIVGDLPAYDSQSRLWTERDQVSQATGMVIAQLAIAPEDALAVLRAHAFAHEASVVEVARLVLERVLSFSDPAVGGGS